MWIIAMWCDARDGEPAERVVAYDRSVSENDYDCGPSDCVWLVAPGVEELRG